MLAMSGNHGGAGDGGREPIEHKVFVPPGSLPGGGEAHDAKHVGAIASQVE